MNIAYILNATVLSGGATKAFLNLIDGLKAYDVKPFVVVPDGNGVTQELKRRNIPTCVTTYRSSAYPNCHTLTEKVLFIPRLIARIVAGRHATKTVTTFLKENKIDIVHSNTGVVRIGFDAAQKAGIPHIYHIREYVDCIGIRYFPTKASFYKQLEKANGYTVCITKGIQKHFRLEGKKTSRVIYDGVFSPKSTMPTAANKNYFLFVGRIQWVKGVDLLLEAYASYCKQTALPLPLHIAGSADDKVYRQELEAIVQTHSLQQHVMFLGECSNIEELMCNARALIIPSRNEGFGFCMPEAMIQGCLAIGRNTAGTKEQLDNGLRVTGEEIGLRYETTEELAALLAEVSSHPADYYRPYTERAFRVVNQLYTQESNARQVYTFYKDVLNENGQ